MVPLLVLTVAGVPITELMSKERVEAIASAPPRRRRDHEARRDERVASRRRRAEMVECILKDKKKILPCSVFLQGDMGIHDLFVGAAVKLGARGPRDHTDLTGLRRMPRQEIGGGRQGARRRDQDGVERTTPDLYEMDVVPRRSCHAELQRASAR